MLSNKLLQTNQLMPFNTGDIICSLLMKNNIIKSFCAHQTNVKY